MCGFSIGSDEVNQFHQSFHWCWAKNKMSQCQVNEQHNRAYLHAAVRRHWPHAVCVTLKNVKNLFAVLCLLLNLHHHHHLSILFSSCFSAPSFSRSHSLFFQEILDFLFRFVMVFWNHGLMMLSEQMCYALMYAEAKTKSTTTKTAAAWEHMVDAVIFSRNHPMMSRTLLGKLWAVLMRQWKMLLKAGSSTKRFTS